MYFSDFSQYCCWHDAVPARASTREGFPAEGPGFWLVPQTLLHLQKTGVFHRSFGPCHHCHLSRADLSSEPVWSPLTRVQAVPLRAANCSCEGWPPVSSGLKWHGCGAFDVSSGWLKLRWPKHWVMSSIALKEFVPLVIAAITSLWSWHWSRGLPKTFAWTSYFVLSMLPSTSFIFWQHIPGIRNTAANALSRTSFSRIFSPVLPVEVPSVVLDEAHPDWSSLHCIELFRRTLFRASPSTQSVPTIQV